MASEHHVPRPQKIKLPPIPPSQLPQNIAPTKLSRGVQLGSFAFATGLTLYAVLVYDFGPKEHCFMPIRRWFDDQTRGLFTLTTKDRQILSPAESKVAVPDRRTPIEFFKENGVRTGETSQRYSRSSVNDYNTFYNILLDGATSKSSFFG